jgi:hypothetical protein
MITGIRSAVLCDRVVTHTDGSIDLVGLWGERMNADSRPGIVKPWLVLMIELDGDGADGQVVLTAPDFEQTVPFQTPPGPMMTMAAFPILLPIVREGTFVVSVVDLRKPGQPVSVKWPTGFAEGAEELDPKLADEFIRGAVEGARLAAAGLVSPKKTQH